VATDPATRVPAARMRQSLDQFEEAFEREQEIEDRRRLELRKRTSNRSRARHIVKTEKRGRVRFGLLFVCLTATVVVVVVVMFETLAWLVGG
jgi:ferric-dicitrate binding protein FerR (iron transport regulator)